LPSENLRHIEQVADTLKPESFIRIGFNEKWLWHLWIGPNNESFLDMISYQTDLEKLDMILGEQLKLYARKCGEGFEKDKSDFNGTFNRRKKWLEHTIFICKNEHNKTKNEVFAEVIKWCQNWQEEYLPRFDPYRIDQKSKTIGLGKPEFTYFEDFLTEEGKKLIPFLLKQYKGAKPQQFAFMLFALYDLNVLDINPAIYDNITQLHKALQSMFGNIGNVGGRYNLSLNLQNINAATQYQQRQIKSHRKKIKKQLDLE